MLENQVILISGASRGIGHATALLLAQQGARVALLARAADELHALAAQTRGLALPADVTNEAEVQRAIAQTLAHYGRLDALICNAGVGSFAELENFSLDEFERQFATNVRGTFLLCKHAVPYFKSQRKGHIVGIASDVAKRTFAYGTAYGATKYAQDALLGSLRKEVRPHGVKVSVIYPGMVDTYFNGPPGGEATAHTHLRPADVAQAVGYVLAAPAHVVVDELMLHPLSQEW